MGVKTWRSWSTEICGTSDSGYSVSAFCCSINIIWVSSSRKVDEKGVAFLLINLRTKYLKKEKDGSKKVFRYLLSDKKNAPPRHALACYYRPEPTGAELFVFDPMTKKHSDRLNPGGIWSLSILKEMYARLKRPSVFVRHGKSRGSDCLWQALRKLDDITSSSTSFDAFVK